MVFKTIRQAIRSIHEGRDDARAAIAQPRFLTTMELIEKLSPTWQKVIAKIVEQGLMTQLADKYRKNLPAHCQQDKDYLQYADSKALRLLAESYFSEARRHNIGFDSSPEGPGVAALELVGYYLLSRSWQDLDHSMNVDAPGLGARMIGLTIEKRIQAFISKHGRSLPRSC